MPLRLFALMIGLALAVLAPRPGAAETAGYDLGLVRTGMKLEGLRKTAWPAGARLLCNGDTDLPTNIESPTRDGIVLPPRLDGLGIIPCTLFAPTADGTWKLKATEFAGAPAQLWALGVAAKEGGEVRVAQIKLWQSDDALKGTIDFITSRLGPPNSTHDNGANWSNDDCEALIGRLKSGGILVVVTDKRLEAEIRKRIDTAQPKTGH